MNADDTTRFGRVAPTVVGIDGSTASAQALRWAGEHLTTGGRRGEVLAVCVRTNSLLPDDLITASAPGEDADPDGPVRAMLDEMVEEAERDFPYLTVARQVLRGHPAHELVRLSHTASLIVVGACGHGAFAGMLLGSVSQHLVNHSHCTVTVVR